MDEKPETLYDKVVWLSENEGCEAGDGMSGLLSCFQYCIKDDTRDKVMEAIRTDVEYIFNAAWEEYEYETEQEENFENRAETVGRLVLSDMIGQGLIGDQDTASHERWIKKIKITVENFA